MFLKLQPKKASEEFGGLKHFLLPLDLGGSVLLISAMVTLFLAMQWGGQRLPWSSPVIIALFISFCVLVVFFILLERRMGDDASIPLKILKQRSIASGAVYLFFAAMPNFSVRHQSLLRL